MDARLTVSPLFLLLDDQPMTLEEAEDLTSSTLSDSTQMTLSNLSSQPMSVSIHSEISAVSQISEAEKHEIEETIESETEEIAEGFDEMSESLTLTENDDDQSSLALDEKCVFEMKDSEKHVRFPRDETTTDIVYTNEQLSQSTEGVLDSASTITSPGDDVTSSVFAHCAVDEFSRGPPKEKSSQEEKEAASMTSSQMTETEPMISSSHGDSEIGSPETSHAPQTNVLLDETEFQGEVEIEAETPTSEEVPIMSDQTVQDQEEASLVSVSPSIDSEVHHTDQEAPGEQQDTSPDPMLGKHVSFDDESPDSQAGPKMDFSSFSLEYGNGMHSNVHQALSYTSSLDVHAPSEVHSLHSDEPPELSPSPSDLLMTEAESTSSQAQSDSAANFSQISMSAEAQLDKLIHSEITESESSYQSQMQEISEDEPLPHAIEQKEAATEEAPVLSQDASESDISPKEEQSQLPPQISLIDDGEPLADQSNEIVISQADLAGPKSDLVVESLDSGSAFSQPLILTDVSLVSKGISP